MHSVSNVEPKKYKTKYWGISGHPLSAMEEFWKFLTKSIIVEDQLIVQVYVDVNWKSLVPPPSWSYASHLQVPVDAKNNVRVVDRSNVVCTLWQI